MSDDRFTHLTYRIENAAVSSQWDTALTPVPGVDGPIPPTADNGSYLYLDIALGNPMGPIEVPMENREVSAANISLSGLPLYPPAGNGALGQPLTLLASNTAEGTLTLASGESRTVRLGFFLRQRTGAVHPQQNGGRPRPGAYAGNTMDCSRLPYPVG